MARDRVRSKSIDQIGELRISSIGVSDQYADAISQFSAYFQEEAALIDDPELLQGVSVMQRLAGL